jgi:transposase
MNKRPNDLKRIKKLHQETSDYKLKYRLLILIHYLNGKSGLEIAQILQVGKDQIYFWLKRYKAEGIVGLYDRKRRGRPRKIDYSRLKYDLKRPPSVFGIDEKTWTLDAINSYLAQVQDIEVSKPYIYEVLRKVGFSLSKPSNSPKLPDLRTKGGKLISSLHLEVMYDLGKRLDAPIHRIITENGIKPTLKIIQSDSLTTVLQGKTEHGMLTIRYEEFRKT